MKKLICAAVLGVFSSATAYSDFRVERFEFEDMKKALIEIQSRGLDIAGVDYDNNSIDIVNTEDDDLIINGKYGTQPESSFVDAISSEYMNPEKIESFLYEIQGQYPDIAKVKVIGTTEEGRSIFAIKISDNVDQDENEPNVLFNGAHHAREIMTPEVVVDTISHIVSNYEKSDEVTSWVNNFETWLVPMVNPDGNHHVWTKEKCGEKIERAATE